MSEHFFKTLKIERFRGIQSLEISGLERVNVFVGKNNCGKTSVLEAAFLLIGISNPDFIVQHQQRRGIIPGESSALRDFFYQREHERGINLSCTQVKGRRTLEICPLYGNLRLGQPSGSSSTVPEDGGTKRASQVDIGASISRQSLIGLKYQFTVHDRAHKDGYYEATICWADHLNKAFSLSLDANYKEAIRALYLSKTGYDYNFVDRMLNAKRKDSLLSVLKSIDPKVEDIKTGSHSLVSVDIGLDSFVPVNLLGDGIMRILNILSSIEYVPNGLLFIDEIENGLHVTALERVWEVILDRSEQSNVQIFLTTHSADVIESLRNVLLTKKSFSDSVTCYRLVKFEKDDATRAYRYSSEQLRQALDSNTDIRLG